MRLGIDFGTTHTVVALVDRGNYPVVSFECGEAVPSQAAVRIADGQLRFGAEAAAVADDPDFVVFRSFKRLLSDAGPLTEVEFGPRSLLLSDLLAGYLAHLRDDLLGASNAELRRGERLEVAIGVPANASNDQRFLTLDAFRRAGFEVLAVLNEPSAAGFEYAYRFRRTVTSKREYVLVYDLGGGTFDSSLIHMSGLANDVITSAGESLLGGDDIDAAIMKLVLDKLGETDLSMRQRASLLDECRRQKEAASSATRRLVIDLETLRRPPLALSMEEVTEACAPLIGRSLDAVEEVMRDPRRADRESVGWNELAGIYVVGGGSSFPPVYRQLREQFGAHRVKRSPHPFAATAIGLASFLDEDAGFELSDCLTRHFGVWRESAVGRQVAFDPIFPKNTRLPRPAEPPLEVVRRYRPAHNLGHFRYVECAQIQDGRPTGSVTPWDDIRFPFASELRRQRDLSGVPVQRLSNLGPEVEERYRCTTAGIFEVTLAVLDDGFSHTYEIARHSASASERRRRAPRAR
jgi:molecular chaperone DnaK (HSP70)